MALVCPVSFISAHSVQDDKDLDKGTIIDCVLRWATLCQPAFTLSISGMEDLYKPSCLHWGKSIDFPWSRRVDLFRMAEPAFSSRVSGVMPRTKPDFVSLIYLWLAQDSREDGTWYHQLTQMCRGNLETIFKMTNGIAFYMNEVLHLMSSLKQAFKLLSTCLLFRIFTMRTHTVLLKCARTFSVVSVVCCIVQFLLCVLW